MTKRGVVLLPDLLLASALHTWCRGRLAEPKCSFLRDPNFWLATAGNTLGIGPFVSRVQAPGVSRWFGHGTQLLGVPALALALTHPTAGTPA